MRHIHLSSLICTRFRDDKMSLCGGTMLQITPLRSFIIITLWFSMHTFTIEQKVYNILKRSKKLYTDSKDNDFITKKDDNCRIKCLWMLEMIFFIILLICWHWKTWNVLDFFTKISKKKWLSLKNFCSFFRVYKILVVTPDDYMTLLYQNGLSVLSQVGTVMLPARDFASLTVMFF